VAETIADDDKAVVLRADAIDLVRGDRALLDQVSFTVRAGEHWALLGANGAGKSTLLHLLATCAHPTRGRIDILGRQLGHVGGGFEYRFTPHIGIFGEATYNWVAGGQHNFNSSVKDFVQTNFGLRFAF